MYDSAVRSTLTASADGGGDSGMRRAGRAGLDDPVVEVVDAGMTDGRLAMTVAMTDSGDTPSVAVAQAERGSREATAIAPTRDGEGEIMPAPRAPMTPQRDAATTSCRETP